MKIVKKLEKVLFLVAEKPIPYPPGLFKKKREHLSNINAIAMIRKVLSTNKDTALSILESKKSVQNFLNRYSTRELAYLMQTVP